MKNIFLLTWLCCIGSGVQAQQNILDIPGIHQLVDASLSENKLQVKARNQQALALANEQANLTLLAKLKATYRTMQQRYNTLGTAISAAQIGAYASPMVSRIISNQSEIIRLAERNPALIGIGYRSELQFADKAQSLIRYVTGLVLSYGDVNQLKPSDRKILFDYVLSELSVVQELSGNMLQLMNYATMKDLIRAANPFQNFIDADKAIAGEILQNAKYLKQ